VVSFDHIDHELLLKAVRLHIKDDWILLYIERWLKAPFETILILLDIVLLGASTEKKRVGTLRCIFFGSCHEPY
jgi:hypothetical protein